MTRAAQKSRPPELRWVKPPCQQRSQETLERLLDAAEAIMLAEGVEAASVVAVTKRARSSVGSFYTRFPDRESLLRAVCLRFGQQAHATIDAVVAPERWVDHSLEEVLQVSVGFMLQVVAERRLLLISLLGGMARDLSLSQLVSGLVRHLSERLHALLLSRAELRVHGDAELRARVVAGVLLSWAQARALRHLKDPGLVEETALSGELARMCTFYLQSAEPPPLPAKAGGGARVAKLRRRT